MRGGNNVCGSEQRSISGEVLFFVARNGFKCSLEIPHMSQFDYYFFCLYFLFWLCRKNIKTNKRHEKKRTRASQPLLYKWIWQCHLDRGIHEKKESKKESCELKCWCVSFYDGKIEFCKIILYDKFINFYYKYLKNFINNNLLLVNSYIINILSFNSFKYLKIINFIREKDIYYRAVANARKILIGYLQWVVNSTRIWAVNSTWICSPSLF